MQRRPDTVHPSPLAQRFASTDYRRQPRVAGSAFAVITPRSLKLLGRSVPRCPGPVKSGRDGHVLNVIVICDSYGLVLLKSGLT